MATSESERHANAGGVWEMYLEIGNAERHFNQLGHQYRVIASTWLLGTFAAVGYVLTKVGANPEDLLGPYRELIIAAVAFAGAIGIMLVWLLDQRVYQKLLGPFFLAALDLEDEHKWLPPIRHEMIRTQRHGTVMVNVGWFYMGCTAILLLIWGGSLGLWVGTMVGCSAGWATLLLAVGITCAWAYAIRRKALDESKANLKHKLHRTQSEDARSETQASP